MEEDETPDRVRARPLGAQAEVAHPGDGADAVEEPRPVHGLGGVGWKNVESAGGRGQYTRAGADREVKVSAFATLLRS